jgi:hypothetical protein
MIILPTSYFIDVVVTNAPYMWRSITEEHSQTVLGAVQPHAKCDRTHA